MLTAQQGSNRMLLSILALALWLISIAGAIASIYWVRQIFLASVMTFGGRVLEAESIAPFLVAFVGLVVVVVIIGSTEYHRRHFLKAGSWRLFAWMIGIEAALAIVQNVFVGF